MKVKGIGRVEYDLYVLDVLGNKNYIGKLLLAGVSASNSLVLQSISA